MRVLITGGAGFIGSNLAHHLITEGNEVILYDNLSRKGVERNLAWLRNEHRDSFRFIRGDVRDYKSLREVVRGIDVVYHLAAQVAVTTSVLNPREDFEINALGTFNLLEAARESGDNPVVVFASTNKVYGEMEDVDIVEEETRYSLRDYPDGIPEERPLDFHSPYGCSKGAADQYVRDYARIYGLPTVVLRISCVYGPRQFGNEDQGWLAHFVISAAFKRPITIYGDGKQVRDILYVDDLIRAFELATKHIDVTAGQVYNIGGGPENTISIWSEFRPILAELVGREIKVSYDDWRPGDQPVYVSDIRKAKRDFGWEPTVDKEEGIVKLWHWVVDNRELFEG
jgi:CDP-paratose 2-epimerase